MTLVLGAVLAGAALASGTQPADTYWSTVEADAPVAQYRLSDAAEAGTLVDSAGTDTANSHGIALGGEGPFPGSKSGAFDGEAYADLTANPLVGTGGFTVELWVNWAGGSIYGQPILDFGSSSTNHMYLTPASTASGHPMLFEIHTTSGNSAQVTAPELSAHEWHLLAVTETSSGTLTLYLDGEQVGQVLEQAVTPSSLGSITSEYLGRSLAGEPGFDGSLSNAAFYATALSGGRVKAHYDAAEFPVNTTAPTISGGAEAGAELTAHPETWTGLAPIDFGYQWQRCDSSGAGCSNISGADEASYAPQVGDVGSTLRVDVTGTNAAGNSDADSASSRPVAPKTPAELGLSSTFGEPGSGDGQFHGPWGLAIGRGGDLFVLDRGNDRVEVFSQAGAYVRQFGEPGPGEGQLEVPGGIAIDSKGDVWILDFGNSRLEEFTEQGEVVRSVGGINTIEGLAVDNHDNVWMADQYRESLSVFDDEGKLLKTIKDDHLAGPDSVSVDDAGHVWVANWNDRIVEFNEAGQFVAAFGAPGFGEGELGAPFSIAASSGTVFVSDDANARVQEFDEHGDFLARLGITGYGPGNPYAPMGLATSSGGDLWVINSVNDTVQKWAPEAPGAPANLELPWTGGTQPGVGSTFSTDVGAWSGSPRRTYTYQWQLCDSSGEACHDIDGATSFSYRPVSDDLGGTLRTVVTATNSYGAASATSTASEVIGDPPQNTQSPTISGTAEAGQQLTASAGEWEGAGPFYSYRWQRCDEHGESCVDIENANAESYTLTPADIGYRLRVLVKALNSYGEITAASSPTGQVIGAPTNTTPPSISGQARQGQTLTAEAGEWAGTPPISYAYQWQSCDSLGESCLDIAGATAASYALSPSNVGARLRVTVTATNTYGTESSTSPATDEILPVLVNIELPVIAGTAQEGQPLTASTGAWEGAIDVYVYQWQRCDEQGESCVEIVNPYGGEAIYTPSANDVGHTIRVVVTAVDESRQTSIEASATSAPSEVVAPAAPGNTQLPVISGEAKEGETLTATAGEWAGTPPISYAYQWQSCDSLGEGCLDVAGATSPSYVLGGADVGTTLRVHVAASNAVGSGEAESDITAVVTSAGGGETKRYIYNTEFGAAGSGDGEFDHPADVVSDNQGNVFVLDRGNDRVQVFNGAGEYERQFGAPGSGDGQLESPDGLALDSEHHVWVLDTGNQRIEEFNEAGSFIRSAGSGVIGSAEGIAVDRNDEVWVSDTYQGRLVVFSSAGDELKVVGSGGSGAGQLDEPEGLDVDASGHVWVAEWGNSRVQEFNEAGEYVSQFGTAGSGPGEISNPYGITAGAGHVFVAETGTDRVQEFNEDGSFVEQLGTAGSEPGQFSLGYPVGLAIDSAEDVWVTDSENNRVQRWTPGEAIAPENTTPPSIVGAAEEGQTLGASTGEWTGTAPIAYFYQWQRCDGSGESCADIAGATEATYVLGPDDVDTTLRVVVTARNAAGSASTTSEPTGLVETAPPTNIEPPTISGGAEEGQTLTAQPGEWRGTAPISYAYQWQSCDSLGESCLDIAGATSSTYGLAAIDLSTTLRVRVTASNEVGSAEATSAPSQVVTPPAPPELGYSSEVGSRGSGNGQLIEPIDVDVNASGDLFVLDRRNNRVEEFDKSGQYLAKFGSKGSGNGKLSSPSALAIDSGGDVWVLDAGNERIEEFSDTGAFIRTVGAGAIGWSEGIAVDRNGDVWVSSTSTGRLLVFKSDGEYLKAVDLPGSEPGAPWEPEGLAIDANGHVWVADYGNSRVEQFNEAGEYLDEFGTEGSGTGEIGGPYGIAVGGGHVFLGEWITDRVQEFDEDGTFIAQLGSPGSAAEDVGRPGGLALDAEELWITDVQNNRVEGWAPEEPGPPVNLAPPTFSGSPGVGSTLTATLGRWRGSPRRRYSYQWQRCDGSGESCVEVAGATTPTYALSEADLGSTLRVAVNATNSWGSASSTSAASEVIGTPPANASLPTISGVAEAGQTLTANPGTWDGSSPITYSYQWQRCDTLGENCIGIESAWEESYSPTVDDEGQTLRVVVFTENSAGEASAISLPTSAVPVSSSPEDIELPSISGTAMVDETMTASTGMWRPSASISYTFQWERCDEHGSGCASIEGATAAPYVPVEDDAGHRLRVTVTATNSTGSGSATSEPTAVVVPYSAPINTEVPTVGGILIRGRVAAATKGLWTTTQPPLSYAYQWQRCNRAGEGCADISGATTATYTLGAEDTADNTLSVVVTATDAVGHATSRASAPRAILHSIRVSEYTYDANGNLASRSDGNGHTTKYEYGPASEQTKVTQADGSTTETGYDDEGQITSQTDGNGHTTKYARNLLGEVARVTDPLGRETSKEYDGAGNLTHLTDPSARTTTYSYDPANRLAEASYSDGTTPSVKYEYDADGNRTEMVDGTGTSTYHYTALDQLSEVTDGHGNSTSHEYDLAGKPTKVTYPNGESVDRNYDANGRLEKVTDWLGNTTSFAYDPDSNVTSTTFPEGTGETDRSSYNLAGQLTDASFGKGSETLASLSYTRDNDGQVASTTTSGLPGEASTASSYDPANRLTKSGSTAYEYNHADNPTKLGSSSAAYDNAGELESSGETSYSSDEQGERTKGSPSSGPPTSYGYDQAGNLTSVSRPAEGETPAIEDSYTYSGDGLRASQTSGDGSKYLTWDQSGGLPLILSDGSYSFIYGPANTPLEQIDSSGHVSYLHHDQQGSVRMLSSKTGSVLSATTYGAYGEVVEHTGTELTPLGYDGQYTDANSGLIYLRARAYDPATAQFLSVDPAVSVTQAPYTYAKDNPTNLGDPSGLSVLGTLESFGEGILHTGIDVVAVGPYALYYGSYELARGINYLGGQFGLPGEVVAHLESLPLAQLQALGLAGDAGIDALKNQLFGNESICDEGLGSIVHVNPLHSYVPIPGEPVIRNAPGIGPKGEVDIEW